MSRQVGDLVMIHVPKSRLPSGTHHKLKARKLGPFHIILKCGDNAYVIDLPPELKISNVFNVKNMSEYFPPDASPIALDDSGPSSLNIGEN